MSKLYLQAQEQDCTLDVSVHRMVHTFSPATNLLISLFSIVTHPVSSKFLSAFRCEEI